MDDPGINAQHVDNRVGQEGTQVTMEILPSFFCFITSSDFLLLGHRESASGGGKQKHRG